MSNNKSGKDKHLGRFAVPLSNIVDEREHDIQVRSLGLLHDVIDSINITFR